MNLAFDIFSFFRTGHYTSHSITLLIEHAPMNTEELFVVSKPLIL
jgi:hypothetical protein